MMFCSHFIRQYAPYIVCKQHFYDLSVVFHFSPVLVEKCDHTSLFLKSRRQRICYLFPRTTNGQALSRVLGRVFVLRSWRHLPLLYSLAFLLASPAAPCSRRFDPHATVRNEDPPQVCFPAKASCCRPISNNEYPLSSIFL
jgi:hypothetical protein